MAGIGQLRTATVDMIADNGHYSNTPPGGGNNTSAMT
jgi:hypothetical protein